MTSSLIDQLVNDFDNLFADLAEEAGVVTYRPEDLHVPCRPDDIIAAGTHMHRCTGCGATWKHDDAVSKAERSQFDEAHTCPSCGKDDVTEKYGDIRDYRGAWHGSWFDLA